MSVRQAENLAGCADGAYARPNGIPEIRSSRVRREFSERHVSAFDTQPAAGNQHIAYARHQDSQPERRKAEKAESGESGVPYGAIHYQVWRSGYNDGAKTSGRQHQQNQETFSPPASLVTSKSPN